MFALAIETTGAYCSVAIIDEKKNITSKISYEKMNHLYVLTPLIKDLLSENNITMKDIDVVAASVGPGSFTGIRIGVSTARAIGQAMGIKCIGVPTLYAFAISRNEAKIEGNFICPIFDARRNQIYGACINKSKEVIKSEAYMLDEFLNEIEKINEDKMRNSLPCRFIFIGDGVEKYKEQIETFCRVNSICAELMEKSYQDAEGVAKVALNLYNEGKFVSYEKLEPEYMRKAEAERKLEERLKNAK